MKNLSIIIVLMLTCFGCGESLPPAENQTALEILTGKVIRKEWSKSIESWNAGGSEYYVLSVKGDKLPPERRTAGEGVILRPSKEIPFDVFKNFVGQTVICRGEFLAGEPYNPPENTVSQMPSPARNPITGETDYPVRGSGFKVYAIEIEGAER